MLQCAGGRHSPVWTVAAPCISPGRPGHVAALCILLQWAPFCEFQYQRPESSSKGQQERIEHTVVYLVDAWSLATHSSEVETQLQVRADKQAGKRRPT